MGWDHISVPVCLTEFIISEYAFIGKIIYKNCWWSFFFLLFWMSNIFCVRLLQFLILCRFLFASKLVNCDYLSFKHYKYLCSVIYVCYLDLPGNHLWYHEEESKISVDVLQRVQILKNEDGCWFKLACNWVESAHEQLVFNSKKIQTQFEINQIKLKLLE